MGRAYWNARAEANDLLTMPSINRTIEGARVPSALLVYIIEFAALAHPSTVRHE
jgi:hypothetical protein